MMVFFFFSSRRRHTRCSRDWSSDVCSSDLRSVAIGEEKHAIANPHGIEVVRIVARNGGHAGIGKLGYPNRDRKSTRLNSSHGYISYAVFCLKKKKKRKSSDRTSTIYGA